MSQGEKPLSDPDFKVLFESAPGLFMVLAPDSPRFTILAASDAFLRATKMQREEILGRAVFDVFPDNPDDPSGEGVGLRASFERVLQRRLPDAPKLQQYDIQHPQDEGWSFESRFRNPLNTPVLDRKGQVLYIIHERKQADEALFYGKAKLEPALQSAGMGAWELDLIGQKRYFDEQVCHCLGIDHSRFAGTAEEFYAAVHPDDRQAIITALESTIATGLPYEKEYRVIWPDGSTHYIATRGRLLRNGEGIPQSVSGIVWDVTERKRAEAALRASEEKFSLAFAGNPAAIALTRVEDGLFLEVNNTFLEMTGYSREEVIGRSARTINLWPSAADADRFVDQLNEKGSLQGWEQEFQIKSGEWITTQLSAQVLEMQGEKMVLSALVDITARKQAEAQLQKAHNELEQKVRERTEELQRVNRTLRMTSECNQILVRAKNEQELMQDICHIIIEIGGYRMAWVGYAEDDIEKTVRPVASLGFEDGYLENAHISWADTERGRGPTGKCIRTSDICVGHNFLEDPELAPWRKEALKRGFRSSIALPLRNNGRVFGAITIYAEEPYAFDHGHELLRELADDLAFGLMVIRSHTERDVARQIAEKRAGQLQALAAELVQTEQKERRQLAKILHDHLQQLLVGAKFGASFIRAKAKSKEIEETTEQLIETLDESIRASRSLTADLSPPVLHEKGLAAGLEWLGRRMIEKHGLALRLQTDPAAEPVSEQVRIFLFESVRELLLNIVKHASVNSAQVRMSRLESGEIELIVADEGAGFDPARVEVHSTTGGFGLFSIRERLNYLGGRIQISAAPGQGSRFTLVAPARLASQSDERTLTERGAPSLLRENAPDEGNLFPAGSKIEVLIADDHPVMRQGLSRLLREQPDIRVIGEAGNGQDAIRMARQLKPDVLLMDISLPDISGLDATRQILADCPGISVVGLSMHEKRDMAEEMLKAGAVAYLTKGGATEHFISAIRACRMQKT